MFAVVSTFNITPTCELEMLKVVFVICYIHICVFIFLLFCAYCFDVITVILLEYWVLASESQRKGIPSLEKLLVDQQRMMASE